MYFAATTAADVYDAVFAQPLPTPISKILCSISVEEITPHF